MRRAPQDAPLVDALIRYKKGRRASFHVPGHKAGAAYRGDPSAADWLGAMGAFDATELPGLDDLHEPSGVIGQAQRLAAVCFGAEQSFFLVGGSTVGNLVAIHAVAGAGEFLVMQRNVHKSAIHGLMLAGAGAVFVKPEQHEATGIISGISPVSVELALDKQPDAKAVFLTSPNYYGLTTDVEAIVAVAHERGKPVIVDEAHGAHLGFHPRFPRSALQCGADIVIQSTHKMLPAMTMGAMLHVQGDRVDVPKLRRFLHMLQSSSPSYPIMASLDWARRELHTRGSGLFAGALKAVDKLWDAIGMKRLRRFEAARADDPMKLLLYDPFGELSGYRLQEQLAGYGIYVEMADERYIVCACSSATEESEIDLLVQALNEINLQFPAKKKEIQQNSSNMIPLQMESFSLPIFIKSEGMKGDFQSPVEIGSMPVPEAAGAISAEMIIPYPPGIPLLYPGEEITEEITDTLNKLKAQGAAVQGAADRSLETIRVWKRQEKA